MPQIYYSARGLGWSLLAAIVIQIAFVLVLQYSGGYSGFTEFDWKSALVSLPMAMGVLFLVLFGFLSSGEVSWSRQGFDFSVLALGAILSTLTLQLFMKTPALPRLFHGRFGQFLTGLLGDDLRAMIALLALGILTTMLFCALTAAVELHLKAAHAGGKVGIADNGFAFLNYVLGLFSLLIYTVIVCGSIEI